MQTNDGKKKNLNNKYLNPAQSLKLEELRKGFNKMLNDKKTKFGKPITYKDADGKTKTLTDFTLSSYGTIFKGTPAEIKSKSEKFNIKTGAIHKALWSRIAERIKKDKKRAPEKMAPCTNMSMLCQQRRLIYIY